MARAASYIARLAAGAQDVATRMLNAPEATSRLAEALTTKVVYRPQQARDGDALGAHQDEGPSEPMAVDPAPDRSAPAAASSGQVCGLLELPHACLARTSSAVQGPTSRGSLELAPLIRTLRNVLRDALREVCHADSARWTVSGSTQRVDNPMSLFQAQNAACGPSRARACITQVIRDDADAVSSRQALEASTVRLRSTCLHLSASLTAHRAEPDAMCQAQCAIPNGMSRSS